MANRFRQRVQARVGRKSFWFAGTFAEFTTASANSSNLALQLNAAALALRPFTIIRTRGIWSIRGDQETVDELQETALGCILVSDQAAAVGISAVPTPVAESGSSWHVFETMVSHFRVVTATGAQEAQNRLLTIDSKAMRKVEEGQTVITVVQNGPNSNGVTNNVFLRTLIKLH